MGRGYSPPYDKYIEYGSGDFITRSPYTHYSIYFRGTKGLGFRALGGVGVWAGFRASSYSEIGQRVGFEETLNPNLVEGFRLDKVRLFMLMFAEPMLGYSSLEQLKWVVLHTNLKTKGIELIQGSVTAGPLEASWEGSNGSL